MASLGTAQGFRVDARAIIAYTDRAVFSIESDFYFDFRYPGMPKRVGERLLRDLIDLIAHRRLQ
jgi:hypothetical protein